MAICTRCGCGSPLATLLHLDGFEAAQLAVDKRSEKTTKGRAQPEAICVFGKYSPDFGYPGVGDVGRFRLEWFTDLQRGQFFEAEFHLGTCCGQNLDVHRHAPSESGDGT